MFGSRQVGILTHPGFNDIGSVVGGVLGFLGSDEQADAAKSAAAQSAAASQAAIDLQRQMYEQTRADQTPWRETGQSSLNMLAQYMGVPSSYEQYYGMSDDELRNALLPEYTRQVTPPPPSAPFTGQFDNGYIPAFLNNALGRAGVLSGGSSASGTAVDEAALAARIAQIKQGLRGYDPKAAQFGSLMRPFSMADYQADPGYAFRLSEGLKALDRSAAARGGLLSGATLKGAQRYGQDMASQEYQNAYNRYQSNQTNQFNRLASMAGLGQTANQALQQAGTNYAGSVGNITMNNAANQGNAALVAGQARASAYGGLGTTLGNALSSPSGSLGQYLSNTFGTTPSIGYGYGEPADWGWGG